MSFQLQTVELDDNSLDSPQWQELTGGLNPSQMQQLAAFTATIRQQMRMVTNGLAHVAFTVFKMQELLPNPVAHRRYCMEQFDFKEANYYRMVRAGMVIATHFRAKEGHIVAEASQLPLTAFQLLNADTDVEVIDAIKQKAQSGKVTEAEVKRMIDDALKDSQAQLNQAQDAIVDQRGTIANLQAQVSEVERDKKTLLAEHNATVNQLHQQKAQTKRTEEERDAHLADLSETREQLIQAQKSTTEIQYVEKEVQVLPPGITNLDEAIEARRTDLTALEQSTAAAQQKMSDLSAKLEHTELSVSTLTQLKASVDSIVAQFPSVLVLKVRETTPEVTEHFDSIAKTLRALADTIAPVGAVNA